MLIKKPRPFLIRILREMFYQLQYPIRKLYWYLFRPTRPGVKTFIHNNGSFVLVKLGYGRHRWYLPGGGVERGENDAAAAIRETKEETGLTLSEVVYVDERVYDSQHKVNRVAYFHAETTAIDLTIDDQEIVDAGWFTLDTLPSDTPSITREELTLIYDWKNRKR